MADHEPRDTRWTDTEGLLSPGPSAVVAFTLAVLVLMGNNLMVQATQALLGELFATSYDLGPFFASWAIGALVPAVASILLARRAITVGAAGWELVLGRAALALAVVAVVYTLVMLLGVAVHMD